MRRFGICVAARLAAASVVAAAGHEQGHAVGLDHSCTAPSLMQGPQATYCAKEPYGCSSETACTFSPQPDDDHGIIALYGAKPGPPGGGSLCVDSAPMTKEQGSAMLESYDPSQIPLDFYRICL